ncbi:hypothetical protein AcV5_002871 [Taiwanofungus camphoratus]|nr:hypothetical protein AcV5_002871 [Antrodia cinnamomea]
MPSTSPPILYSVHTKFFGAPWAVEVLGHTRAARAPGLDLARQQVQYKQVQPQAHTAIPFPPTHPHPHPVPPCSQPGTIRACELVLQRRLDPEAFSVLTARLAQHNMRSALPALPPLLPSMPASQPTSSSTSPELTPAHTVPGKTFIDPAEAANLPGSGTHSHSVKFCTEIFTLIVGQHQHQHQCTDEPQPQRTVVLRQPQHDRLANARAGHQRRALADIAEAYGLRCVCGHGVAVCVCGEVAQAARRRAM